MNNQNTFLILSTTDWDAPQFGSRQQIALRLARRYRVLYVDQPRALHSLISDRQKSLIQLQRWLKGGLRQPIPTFQTHRQAEPASPLLRSLLYTPLLLNSFAHILLAIAVKL